MKNICKGVKGMLKKTIILLLSSILIFSNLSVSAMASDKTIKVSIDNIEEVMLEYSPELKIADNNLKKAIEQYDDLKEDINDLKKEIDKLEKDKKELENKPKNKNTNEIDKNDKDAEKLKELQSKIELKKESLKQKEDSKDSVKYNLKISRIQYDQKAKATVFSAQQQYVNYLDTLTKKQLKENDTNSKKKEINSYKIKYDMGFISEKEYRAHGIDTTEVDNNFEELVNLEETELKELKNTLGLSISRNIKLNDDINLDLERISKIDFESDLSKMLDNSRSIEEKKLELDQAEDVSDYDYDVDNAEIYLKQEKNNAKLQFEKQYNLLMTSYNTIKTINDRLTEKQNDFDIMKIKHNYGFVSRKQTEDLENELNKQNSDLILAKNKLYIDYLHYLQMKQGY